MVGLFAVTQNSIYYNPLSAFVETMNKSALQSPVRSITELKLGTEKLVVRRTG